MKKYRNKINSLPLLFIKEMNQVKCSGKLAKTKNFNQLFLTFLEYRNIFETFEK